MTESHAPEVGMLLGSKSDLPLARKAEDIFAFFAVSWEITIASAHRTPCIGVDTEAGHETDHGEEQTRKIGTVTAAGLGQRVEDPGG